MRRPSSPAQLALIELPPAASPRESRPRARRAAQAAWRRAQAAANARSSEVLLAELERLASVAHPDPDAPVAPRPHPPAALPSTPLTWREESLVALFEAVERASANAGRRAAS